MPAEFPYGFKPHSVVPKDEATIEDCRWPIRVLAHLKDGISGQRAEVEAWAIAWTRERVLVTWREGVEVRHVWLRPGMVRRY